LNKKYLKKISEIKKNEKSLILNNFRKSFKVLLVYPNSYNLGMSNLGFQTIYKVINSHPEFSCERSFLPDYNVMPVSFETLNFPATFDIIIFSISFEIDFLNVIKFLKLSKIPYYKKNRKNYPVMAAGGIAITLNYKPLYDILDYFLIGEGEELILKFLNKILNNENPEDIEGIIGQTKTTTKRIIYQGEIAHSVFFCKHTEFPDSFLIEIARGCKYKCNFCAASYNYSPYRTHKFDKIKDVFENNLKKFKKVGLIGSTVTSHPDFIKICSFLNNEKIPFSVTSLRLDSLTYEILDALISGKNKTFTVAVESASDKLREKINKKLTSEQIFEAISKFIEKKIINLKFYFMIGLPGESFEDIKEIISFMSKIREIYISKKSFLKYLGKFHISINPFIPKPNTPFYNCYMENPETLHKKIEFLKNQFKKIPNMETKFENIPLAYIQGFIAKGDSKIGEQLIEMVENNIKPKLFLKENFKQFPLVK
jgi:radical SAM superfamily enzyme YgiQ (UPF0313 family)